MSEMNPSYLLTTLRTARSSRSISSCVLYSARDGRTVVVRKNVATLKQHAR